MNDELNNKFPWISDPNNDKVLIVMRGIPSSGKSFRALELAGNDPSLIQSADHYFGKTPEEYVANWCFTKLAAAHKQCQNNALAQIQKTRNVIVDNTNTTLREIYPYFDMALKHQYRFQIEEPTSPWWVNDIAPYLEDKEDNREHLKKMCNLLWEKNQLTHKVPLESIEKMMFRYHYNVTVTDLLSTSI